MAKISTSPVSPKMYRHFAVATLVVTLLMAIISDGENREAIANEIAARERAAELAKANAEKFGKPVLVKAEPQAARLYNSNADYRDSNADFGAPMDRVGSRTQDTAIYQGRINRGGGRYVPTSYTSYEVSEEELAAMTPEERTALLAKIDAGGLSLDPVVRRQQIQRLLAASRNRSGGEGDVEAE